MNFPTEANANHEPLSALDIYARFRERLRSLPKTATEPTEDDERVALAGGASQPSQSQTPLDWRGDGKDDGRPSRKPPIVHIPPKRKKNETSNVQGAQISGISSLFEEDEEISEGELREFLSKLDWSRLHE